MATSQGMEVVPRPDLGRVGEPAVGSLRYNVAGTSAMSENTETAVLSGGYFSSARTGPPRDSRRGGRGSAAPGAR